MFDPLLNCQKHIYKIDCQCLSEVEYLISNMIQYCQVQEEKYEDVVITDRNYNQFLINDTIYYIHPYKQNRNIKFVYLEEQQCSSSYLPTDLTTDSSSDSSSDVESISEYINNLSQTHTIYKKIFFNDRFNIIVYSIYQNDYMLKTFALFDNVSLFKYFYKEPYLYDVFQSVIGHYNYINQNYLEKDKMYYFYKISHLQEYVIKIYVYQLNQGRWCSWDAETNIILGLDLSRPFYVIQFLENIDDKKEKIYIDVLNRSGTSIDDRVMFVQNIFGKEFVYPRQSVSMQEYDQGIIIESSEGVMRQFLW